MRDGSIFPAWLPQSGHWDGRCHHPCRLQRSRPSRRHAAWLCRHWRHVGGVGDGVSDRPHRHRPRPARYGLSFHPASGHDKKTLAHEIARILERVVGQCASIDEATRQHYAKLYARPGAMHSTFEQSAAFYQDAIDNKVYAAKGKVLAIGDPLARPWRTTCASLPRTSLGRLFQIPDIG